jgi:DeoR/GlpR family transcriptional regulator of sugar metabolism
MLDTIKQIKQFHQDHNRYPNVSELARLMGVTRVTIYKRLDELERGGKLERVDAVTTAGYKLVDN